MRVLFDISGIYKQKQTKMLNNNRDRAFQESVEQTKERQRD